MTSPLLAELEASRGRLFERLASVGDFRRGSASENWQRCGKSSCRRCAEPGSRGHGPRWLWTRTAAGRGTIGRQLRPEELGKVRAELENYQRFASLAEEIAEVSEAICEARPIPAAAGQAPEPEGQKKGPATRSPRAARRMQPPR
ncbi:MAG: DUF6788 family protein [Streptosporangiaceae bacterium]